MTRAILVAVLVAASGCGGDPDPQPPKCHTIIYAAARGITVDYLGADSVLEARCVLGEPVQCWSYETGEPVPTDPDTLAGCWDDE